jgi:hypothetical protein
MTCRKAQGVLPLCIRFALAVGISLQTACSQGETAVKLSDLGISSAGFEGTVLHPGGISIAAARRVDPAFAVAPVRVYIEGDGRAYLDAGHVSADPTPQAPVGLELARADTAPNVVYLARPCQYLGHPLPAECADRTLYTTRRWSPEVVDAYVRAIAPLATPARPVTLTGFSGGAYLALAVASRLPEGSVSHVTTVAGNLLPNAVAGAHRIPGLDEALIAPLDFTKLAAIPQTHYVGTADKVIPASLKDSFLAAAGPAGREAYASRKWQWIQVSGATHTTGWSRIQP